MKVRMTDIGFLDANSLVLVKVISFAKSKRNKNNSYFITKSGWTKLIKIFYYKIRMDQRKIDN